jgi:hypothetical protein
MDIEPGAYQTSHRKAKVFHFTSPLSGSQALADGTRMSPKPPIRKQIEEAIQKKI